MVSSIVGFIKWLCSDICDQESVGVTASGILSCFPVPEKEADHVPNSRTQPISKGKNAKLMITLFRDPSSLLGQILQ